MAKHKNPIIIIDKGINISLLIVGPSSLKILEGWWRVFHQSTENFIIGRLIAPKIDKIDAGFEPSVSLSNALESAMKEK